jgi:hypothetical protein
MNTIYKPYTIEELVTLIYEENLEHFKSFNDDKESDCDCTIHTALGIIVTYWGE